MKNQTITHMIFLSILSTHACFTMDKNKDNDTKESTLSHATSRAKVIIDTEKNRRATFRNTALTTFRNQKTDAQKQNTQSTLSIPLPLIKAFEGIYAGRYPRVMQEMREGTFDFQDRVEADNRINRSFVELTDLEDIETIEKLQCSLEAANQELTSTSKSVLKKFVQTIYEKKINIMSIDLEKKLKELADAGNNTQKSYEDNLKKLIQLQQIIGFDKQMFEMLQANLQLKGNAHLAAISQVQGQIATLAKQLQTNDFARPAWQEAQ